MRLGTVKSFLFLALLSVSITQLSIPRMTNILLQNNFQRVYKAPIDSLLNQEAKALPSNRFEQSLKRKLLSTKKTPRLTIDNIPVIVNIIYGPSQSGNSLPFPDDAAVINGIDWINNLLGGGPACPGNPISVETGIRLCLATRDINGNPTTGIRRYSNSLSDMDLCKDDLQLKAIPRQGGDLFPDSSYLNLYIVNQICASCKPGDCLAGGYAAYPSSHGTALDGIVLEAITWMNNDCDVRKVILHELGHYFNLRHTWDGNTCKNENCLIDGDGVCDTPPDFDINIYASNPCLQGIPVNTCVSDINPMDPNNPFLSDQPDMTSNLMDYAPPGCIAIFTNGQVERMHHAIEGPRSSLLRSHGCETPCQNPITLNVQWPITPILYGNPIIINQQSQSDITYSWTWYNGPTTSNDLIFPADSVGTFVVCLTATNSNLECTANECDTITVLCSPSPPEITLSDYQVDFGDTVIVTQTSPPIQGYNYTLFVNGLPAGTSLNSNFMAPPGSSVVWMEECGGGCCSESQHYYLSSGSCPSGKEANHWFFGLHALHLEWNSGMPIEQSPANSGIFAEASTSAVAPDGSLLFYTNNSKVFNRNHQPMANGDLNSDTGPSATQCITIPKPGSDSLWYLFYPDGPLSGDLNRDTITKLYYGVIDMSLNLGLGDVIEKDHIVLQPSSEKVAAVRHCNGIDWWIVGHESGSNKFYSWLLSENGLGGPIINSIGITKSKRKSTPAGEMNISPDGTKIALSTGPDYTFEAIPSSTVELFDFDVSTGIVSNAIKIGDFRADLPGYGVVYGLEFSPSSKLLYLARGHSRDTILQYDLTNPVASEILNSRRAIYAASDPSTDEISAMLTGPDGKIYVGNLFKQNIGVIQYPNLKGTACNFNSNGLILATGQQYVGLPTFPADIFTPWKPNILGPDVLCDTSSEAKYYVVSNCRYQDYEWKVLGNSKVLRHQGDTVWLEPGIPGVEQLIVNKFTACGIKTDTFEINVESCGVNEEPCSIDFTWNEADTVVCKGEDAWLHFNSQASIIEYELASEGILHSLNSPILTVSDPQTNDLITLHLETIGGCDTTLNIGIHVNPSLEVDFLTADSLVCKGESAILNINHIPNYLVEIFPEDAKWVITNPVFPLEFGPVDSDSTLYVRIRDNQQNCDSIFKWDIRVENPSPMIIDTFWICTGDSIFLAGNWYRSEDSIDEYFTRIGCDSVHRSVILLYPKPVTEFTINDPCKGANGSIEITIHDGESPFLYSINGETPQSNPLFENLLAGNYLVSVLDGFGCIIDTLVQLTEGTGIGNWSVKLTQPSCDLNNGIALFEAEVTGIQFSLNGAPFSADTIFNNLTSGPYEVIASHPLGCIDTINFLLIQTGKPAIKEVVSEDPHCGQTDGSIFISSVVGGASPYQYSLGNSNFDSFGNYHNLSAGSYSLFVKDSALCEIDTIITLNGISGPIIEDILINPALCGLPEGIIEIKSNPTTGLLYNINKGPTMTLPVFSSLLPGSYLVEVSDSFGCNIQQNVIVPDSFTFQISKIEIKASQCQSSNGQINISIDGSPVTVTITELPGKIYSNLIEDLDPGIYHLHLQDVFNCFVDTTVIVSSTCEIYLPNVFSPNGDGINDVFGVIENNSIQRWELQIFDRSGNMVYRSDDPSKGWNGHFHTEPVQSGVYAWKLEYKFFGELQTRHKKGDLTLIR